MKALNVLVVLVTMLVLTSCGELLPTEPVTSASPAVTSTDTRATLGRNGNPPEPFGPGFTVVKLEVVGAERIPRAAWVWAGPTPPRAFGVWIDKGGLEPDPEFITPGTATSFTFPSWNWNEPTARVMVAAQWIDTDGTIRWKYGTWSNAVQESVPPIRTHR